MWYTDSETLKTFLDSLQSMKEFFWHLWCLHNTCAENPLTHENSINLKTPKCHTLAGHFSYIQLKTLITNDT